MKKSFALFSILFCSFLFINAKKEKIIYMSAGEYLQDKISEARSFIHHQPVKILISAGVYKEQSISLYEEDVSHRFKLTIRAKNLKNKPIFDGQKKNRFLTLKSSSNSKTNLHIEGLVIKNYNEAISLNGNELHGYNSHNSIKNSEFVNIGSLYSYEQKAYAVVRLLNSRYNMISGNVFKNNQNKSGHTSLLHSVYIAHQSHRNTIINNKFINISGDPIRFRNYSNFNLIRRNMYTNSLKLPAERILASNWYCSKKSCRVKECPSLGNRVLENQFTGSQVTVNHTDYIERQTFCNRKIDPSKLAFKSAKNINTEKGVCTIQALNKCPRILTYSHSVIDFLSSKSHSSAKECHKRSRDYYKSCYKNSNNGKIYNAIKSTWYKKRKDSNGSITKVSENYSGKGCFFRAQNCSRMRLKNHTLKKDFLERVQERESSCLDRSSSWLRSCSKEQKTKPRYVEMTFFDSNYKVKKLVGNGCIISANKCQRRRIPENGHLVDPRASAHKNTASCLLRAKSWLSSCSKGESSNTLVKIKASFFRNGDLLDKVEIEGFGLLEK